MQTPSRPGARRCRWVEAGGREGEAAAGSAERGPWTGRHRQAPRAPRARGLAAVRGRAPAPCRSAGGSRRRRPRPTASAIVGVPAFELEGQLVPRACWASTEAIMSPPARNGSIAGAARGVRAARRPRSGPRALWPVQRRSPRRSRRGRGASGGGLGAVHQRSGPPPRGVRARSHSTGLIVPSTLETCARATRRTRRGRAPLGAGWSESRRSRRSEVAQLRSALAAGTCQGTMLA